MKRNALLMVVGVIAVGAIGFAVYKSIKNARDAKAGE
jgi:preprotein translocase subunit Sss1